jgi:hypothetical protein
MNRPTTNARIRVFACLAAGAAAGFVATADARASQSPSTLGAPPRSSVTATAPDASAQQSQPPEPLWQRASYGARGAISVLKQESLETGIGVSGFAVLPVTADLEIEAEIGFQTMTTVDNGLPEGRLTIFPLRGTLRVQMWRFGGALPYLGGGGGIYFHRFSLSDTVTQALEQLGLGASASVDPGLGLHFGGGAEWQRDRFRFGVDVKYVIADADAQSTIVDQLTGEIFRETSKLEIDGLWIAAGGRIIF